MKDRGLRGCCVACGDAVGMMGDGWGRERVVLVLAAASWLGEEAGG